MSLLGDLVVLEPVLSVCKFLNPRLLLQVPVVEKYQFVSITIIMNSIVNSGTFTLYHHDNKQTILINEHKTK